MRKAHDILRATHQGFAIFKRVLSYYYEDSLLLGLSIKQCLPAQNPFNGGRETLLVKDCFVPTNDGSLKEMVCYQDNELPDFKGNAFDFAALHYKLEGQALLEKINQDLYLHLGEEKGRKETGGREKGEGRREKGGRGEREKMRR